MLDKFPLIGPMVLRRRQARELQTARHEAAMRRAKFSVKRLDAKANLNALRLKANEAKATLNGLRLAATVTQVESLAELQKSARSQVSQLNIYGGADQGRQNSDWNTFANWASADLAIIPDTPVINARARQLTRDCWLAESIVKAWCRNIAGIRIVPAAVDADGNPLTALNAKIADEFHAWAGSKECDIEGKQTLNQKQRLAVRERANVGQHLISWAYTIPRDAAGRIDHSKPVGLQLQSFEPEQLDQRLISYQGNEVRGGVEVNANGKAVAYHLYTRNPNDYLFRRAYWSKRVDRSRVWHYFSQDRVLQTQGITPLAPVMQDLWDFQRYQKYTMWKVIMDACIGVIFYRQTATPIGTIPGLPPASGELNSPTTPSGAPTIDYMPGMHIEAKTGEKIEPFNTGNAGQVYGPFAEVQIRGIGAGVGLSYGQVARRSEGNYSAARQDMLEDRREWEPEQQLLIDDFLRPMYELWMNLAAMEGRFDGIEGFDLSTFLADRRKFVRADYIPRPAPWIDPEKEANAFAILLANRLITREEIVALRGARFFDLIGRIATENKELKDLDLSIPEDAKEREQMRDLIGKMVSNRLGTLDNLAANETDIGELVEKAGLPRRAGFVQPTLPITSPAPPGSPPGNSPPPAAASDGNGVGVRISSPAPQAGKRVSLEVIEAPNYRMALDPDTIACPTCSYNVAGTCVMFNFQFDPDFVCDSWMALGIAELPARAKTKVLPPVILDNTRGIMRDFQPDVPGRVPPG